MKKDKINILIGISSGVILFFYIYFVEGMQNISLKLKQVIPIWVVYAVLCMIVYWICESIVLHQLVARFYQKQKFWNSVKVTMIGQFFNSVTPFATGGQPMQAFTMTQDGIEVGIAGTVLMAKFIIYQGVLTIYSLVVLVFQVEFFKQHVKGFIYLAIIGFLVNVAVILLLLAFTYMEKPTSKLMIVFLRFLHKLKIVKNIEQKEKQIKKGVQSFHHHFILLKQYPRMLCGAIILTIIQLTTYFLVPYMLYKSFGLQGASILSVISAQAFVLMISSFVPIPGAAGAAEGSFFLFFSLFFPKNCITMAILFWRIITFYFAIALGGVTALLSSRKTVQQL